MSSKTILVIEDNEGLLDLYTVWLKSEGYDVVSVSDGESALEAWDDSIDAALVDLRIPKIRGTEVIRQAVNGCDCEIESGCGIPIAVISAADIDLDEDIDCCIDEYIIKPIEQPEIVTTFNGFLSDKT